MDALTIVYALTQVRVSVGGQGESKERIDCCFVN